ncbi:putative phosphogluconate dehydrogenase (NADP(+)-dependent, decarboxylating) [Helianthus anomalus]
MNLIHAKSNEKGWNLKLGELARIWKGGCIIRAIFLDRIKQAYDRNPELANLLVDPEFAKEMIERQSAWRRVVCLAINSGISTPGMSPSLAYFDAYRRERLPANLVQAQRDCFGVHTYERTDVPGSFHTEGSNFPNRSKTSLFWSVSSSNYNKPCFVSYVGSWLMFVVLLYCFMSNYNNFDHITN